MAADWRANPYLTFEGFGRSASGKTGVWRVLSKSQGSLLGMVKWYGPWRQYIFEPMPDCVFNNGCLDAISSFCSEQNATQRTSAVAS